MKKSAMEMRRRVVSSTAPFVCPFYWSPGAPHISVRIPVPLDRPPGILPRRVERHARHQRLRNWACRSTCGAISFQLGERPR